MTSRRAGPWYGFLYRLLGAHGTFWLWVLSVVAMWWTWQGALVRILDREPEHRTVSELGATTNIHRWVSLYGVEVLLDGWLLGRGATAPEVTPTPLLIDANDPAAKFWLGVKLCAAIDAGIRSPRLEREGALLGDLSAVAPRALRQHAFAVDVEGKLIEAATALRKNPKACLPLPGASILLLRGVRPAPDDRLPQAAIGSGGTLGPATAVDGGRPTQGNSEVHGTGDPDEIDPYVSSILEWAERVRARVHVSFPNGLLDSAPRSLVERLEKDPGIELAPSALQVDRRPRDGELYVFCAASMLMVFLAAGFYGAPDRLPRES